MTKPTPASALCRSAMSPANMQSAAVAAAFAVRQTCSPAWRHSSTVAAAAALKRMPRPQQQALSYARSLQQQQKQKFLHRSYSTASPAQQPSAPPPPPSPSTSSRRGPRVSSFWFAVLGVAFASPALVTLWRTHQAQQLSGPAAGVPRKSAQEAALKEEWKAAAAAHPKFASLLARLEDPSGPFSEWPVGARWVDPGTESLPEPSTAQSPARATPRLTSGALGGFDALGAYHRVFKNSQTGELVSVVHLGPAVSGWPNTAHGGVLATLLDEALGRCAITSLPARTGVTARLELQYRRPVIVPAVYVITCTPEWPEGVDSAQPPPPDLRKLWCSATLADLENRVCVSAKGLFVVPKGYALQRVDERF